MTWIVDGSGRRWVDVPPRKRRKAARALRFADLQPGAVLIHRVKTTTMQGGHRDPLAANDDTPWMVHHHVGFALCTDRWFDPVAGQRDETAGQMVAVKRISPRGIEESKDAHTLRGLAMQGYHYAMPEQAERILAAVAERAEIQRAWLAGEITKEAAIMRAPTWPLLIKELGLEPPPPEKDKAKRRGW